MQARPQDDRPSRHPATRRDLMPDYWRLVAVVAPAEPMPEDASAPEPPQSG
ncbi:MAG TPA: hypothetical protein VM573_00630 [Actinomycetota bacterium]|jgi:hypothetical protein|nr:hypothetical protein [Actinomycetota bacterium]